ncbi:hypothetical protein QZH41_012442, partial [Actinostola sp. cb2023]
MPEHKRACSFRTVTCNECFDIVALRHIEDHKREHCSYRKLPCPFYRDAHDAHDVAWIDRAQHLNDCEERVRQCLVPGCHFYGTQSSMTEHDALSSKQHNKLLRRQFEDVVSLVSTK